MDEIKQEALVSYEIKHVAPLGGSGVILPSSADEFEEVVLLKEIK